MSWMTGWTKQIDKYSILTVTLRYLPASAKCLGIKLTDWKCLLPTTCLCVCTYIYIHTYEGGHLNFSSARQQCNLMKLITAMYRCSSPSRLLSLFDRLLGHGNADRNVASWPCTKAARIIAVCAPGSESRMHLSPASCQLPTRIHIDQGAAHLLSSLLICFI